MSRTRLRGARPVVLAALLASASLLVGVTPAHAATGSQTLNNTCTANLINNDGSTGTIIPPGTPFPLSATVPDISGPTEVNAHATFNGVGTSISVPVPDAVDTKVPQVGNNGVVPVEGAANLQLTIEVDGAASIGTPKVSGGDVFNATAAKISADQVLVTFPGKDATTKIPGDDHWFVGGSTFTSPSLTIPITAGNAGTKVTAKLVKFQSDALADVFATTAIPTRAFCDPDPNTVGTVQVVTPPPPGAPNAVADVAQTDEGAPVTINVLANDVANAQVPIDTSSLAITKNPSHGGAKINTADHTVTYTPNAGFAGSDSFTYKLCSLLEAPTTTTTMVDVSTQTAAVEACDTATVTVTVVAPVQQVTASTPTTAAAATTATTAAAELPRTGSSSMPLALTGFGLCVVGLATTGLARSRRRVRHGSTS
jgi:hypothetical protein